jgi:hypothetical protein
MVNGFIDRLYTRPGTYSTTFNVHNSQIDTAAAKHSPACCVFTSRSLATTTNSEDSSTSHAQVLSSQSPIQNSLNSKSELLYNWRFTANQIILESGPLRLTIRDFFFFVFPTELLRYSLKSKSKLLYDPRFTASQFVLASSHSRPTTRHFFPQLNPCGNSPFVTSSLTRRWGCLL